MKDPKFQMSIESGWKFIAFKAFTIIFILGALSAGAALAGANYGYAMGRKACVK